MSIVSVMKKLVLFLLLALSCAGCASIDHNTEAKDTGPVFDYTCEGGISISVSPMGDGSQGAGVTLGYKDRTYDLNRVVAGSGEKYSNGSLIWWSKGNEGFLQVGDKVILQDCRLQH